MRAEEAIRAALTDLAPHGEPDAAALDGVERAVGRRRRQRAASWAVVAMVAVTAAVAAVAVAAGPDAGAGYSIRPGESTTAPLDPGEVESGPVVRGERPTR
jgi:hypothetical protein